MTCTTRRERGDAASSRNEVIKTGNFSGSGAETGSFCTVCSTGLRASGDCAGSAIGRRSVPMTQPNQGAFGSANEKIASPATIATC